MMNERQLNECGFSLETIAAEYETDQALVEAGNNMNDPYFKAAWSAESKQRNLDWQSTRQQSDSLDDHPLGCTCIFCIPGA